MAILLEGFFFCEHLGPNDNRSTEGYQKSLRPNDVHASHGNVDEDCDDLADVRVQTTPQELSLRIATSPSVLPVTLPFLLLFVFFFPFSIFFGLGMYSYSYK